jgi:hypothetical protein
VSSPTNPIELGPGYQQTGQYTGATGTWVPPIVKEAITSASSAPPIQPGTGYRYLSTHVLSGKILGDWLPITGQSFTRTLNATGTGTCALNSTGDQLTDSVNVAGVLARQAVLWVLQDGAVIWNGLCLDWQHQSILDGTLPLNCADLSYIFSRRVINTTLTYTNEDIFDIARNLVGYGLGKSPNGGIANLTFSGGESGITDSMTFASSQRVTVLDALNTLVSTYSIEWNFRPYQDAGGNFYTSFDLSFPALGLSFPQSGLVYNFPGNLLDYSFMAMGSASANRVLTTATNTDNSGDTLTGRATDNLDLSAGYPLFELQTSASTGTWTSDAQVAAFATGYLPSVTDTQLTPLLTLPGGQYPALSQTVLGSYAQVSLTSWLHPPTASGAPGFTGLGRVTSWTLTPPSAQQAETTQIQLGNMTMTGDPGNVGITN